MPSGDLILAGLTATANDWRWLAIAWHLLLAALVVAVLIDRRLSTTRLIACVVIASVLSVSVLRWASGNPFNGIVFAALAVTLVGATSRAKTAVIRIERRWRAMPGAALVVFGWTYPHFVSAESWIDYAYAAPFGLVPCPTLSMAIGLTLLIRDVGGAAWRLPLIAAGVLYAMVGVFALGVVLDVVLFGGAVMLAVVAISDHTRS